MTTTDMKMKMMIMYLLTMIMNFFYPKPKVIRRRKYEKMDAIELYTINKLNKYFKKHKLKGWNYLISKQLTSSGANCNYTKKLIKISHKYIHRATKKEIKNTILHEIAHALTPKQHHNKVWKKMAISIGCNGKRCHRVNMR